MLFNSIPFAVFFIPVFLGYYLLFKEKVKQQNWFLLLASYFFYGYASWKMLPVIFVATVIFYGLGILIFNLNGTKKASFLTTLGVILGVGILVYFKYLNFLVDSFQQLFAAMGFQTNWNLLHILMPLGVSYFTFKLISYVIEISRGKIEPCKDFVAFATYCSFFPTIMAGPIDRPNTFIQQLQRPRSFNYDITVNGCKQILWGLFVKTVIADNLAVWTEGVWNNVTNSSGYLLFLTAVFYCIQMYADFSGYSNMAIGIGKILGLKVTKNFNYPFFATNVADLWRRWHISLTSWVTDYVFMPLNVKFRNLGKTGLILAIIINMVVVGMWHGANWTYAVFGIYQGVLFIPLILSGSFFKKHKEHTTKLGLPTLKDASKMVGVFLLLAISMVFFRAENVEQACYFISKMFSPSLFQLQHATCGGFEAGIALFFFTILLIVEWIFRKQEYGLELLGANWTRPLRWTLYFAIIAFILIFSGEEKPFIYFQF